MCFQTCLKVRAYVEGLFCFTVLLQGFGCGKSAVDMLAKLLLEVHLRSSIKTLGYCKLRGLFKALLRKFRVLIGLLFGGSCKRNFNGFFKISLNRIQRASGERISRCVCRSSGEK